MRESLRQIWSEYRLFAPAALLGIGCLFVFGVHLQRPIELSRPLKTMPLQLAGYTGVERSVPLEEQQVAGMTDYVFRIFGSGSVPAFTLYIGYYDSQTTGRTIHSPKNCLPGAGWEELESGVASVDPGNGHAPVNVNRYMLANGTARALVYYWYQGRGRVENSEYRVKWELLRDAMVYGRSEEALVRIVVPIATDAKASAWQAAVSQAESTAQRVARELVPRVDQALPAWGSRGPRV